MKYCDATSKGTGQQCRQRIPEDAVKCKWHGGASPNAKAGQAKRAAVRVAVEEIRRLGGSVEGEPGELMLAMVHEAAHNVAVYRHLVAGLEGDDFIDQEWTDKGPGKKAPHVWIALYDAERDKLVRWSKLCLDAGVAERRIRLAESQAEQLASVVRDVVDGMVVALAAAGLPEDVLASTVSTGLPGIMRAAFEKAHAIEVESREAT